MRDLRKYTVKCLALVLLLAAFLVGCKGSSPTGSSDLDINGTYVWGWDLVNDPRGTITFTQRGTSVTATTVHYSPGDRPLLGGGTLDGNTLSMHFVLESGETDYAADATFVFSSDGSTFEGTYTDTNGESGLSRGMRQS